MWPLSESYFIRLCPAPRWGHYAVMTVVCPSVCPVPKSRPEGRSKLRIGRIKPMTWVTRDPTQRSKGQRSGSLGRLIPWPKIRHILGTERPTNFKLGTRMELIWPASPTCAVTSKVKGYNVTLSVWRVFAHNSTRKVVETSKWAEGCPCYAWHCTPVPRSNVKGQGHQMDKMILALQVTTRLGQTYRTPCSLNELIKN